MVNKPLKIKIRRKYEDLISKRGKFVPEKHQEISKEELVQIVEESYHEIYSRNKTDQYIKNAFEMCGLNPWGKNQSAFQKHLDGLSENSIYRSLITCNFDRDISTIKTFSGIK